LLLDYILLIHFKQIKGERTDAAIFHILKGKQSIQTVQDIHIFNLEKFYGAARFLNKKQFDGRVENLRVTEKIKEQAETNQFAVTQKGIDWLKENKSAVPINYFNGYRYDRTASEFYERLLLLIQTFTNSKMNNFSFIPVISNRSAENWVKSFYGKTIGSRQEVLPMLYKELAMLLSHSSRRESEIFVDRLSGYNVYGLSINQLATAYGLENEDVSLMLTGVIHHILSMVEKETNKYPLMGHIIQDLINTSALSHSAAATLYLLNKRYSIPQIASRRQLKDNTIYDHIVEIAYNNDQFPVTNYVSKDRQDLIIKTIQHAQTLKLKEIKKSLGDEFSYFEIRLVLAAYRNLLKIGDTNE